MAGVVVALGAGSALAGTMHPTLGAKLSGMGEHGDRQPAVEGGEGIALLDVRRDDDRHHGRVGARCAGMTVAKLGSMYKPKGCAMMVMAPAAAADFIVLLGSLNLDLVAEVAAAPAAWRDAARRRPQPGAGRQGRQPGRVRGAARCRRRDDRLRRRRPRGRSLHRRPRRRRDRRQRCPRARRRADGHRPHHGRPGRREHHRRDPGRQRRAHRRRRTTRARPAAGSRRDPRTARDPARRRARGRRRGGMRASS